MAVSWLEKIFPKKKKKVGSIIVSAVNLAFLKNLIIVTKRKHKVKFI
jgi:hypothetical protein